MSVGERIKLWRTQNRFNQKEAAGIFGVSHSLYQKYEANRSMPGGESLMGFLKAGVNLNWLLLGVGEMHIPQAHRLALIDSTVGDFYWEEAPTSRGTEQQNERLFPTSSDAPSLIDAEIRSECIWLPMLESKRMDSGQSLLNEEQASSLSGEQLPQTDQPALKVDFSREFQKSDDLAREDTGSRSEMAFKKTWFSSHRLTPEACAYFIVRGDSMAPTLADGDVLLIDRSVTSVNEDAIYLIEMNQSLVAKRIQQSFGALSLISDNNKYAPLTIPRDSSSDLKIVGRVRWAGHCM
jgi:transcriptional regulator with XRE-family HTH domain